MRNVFHQAFSDAALRQEYEHGLLSEKRRLTRIGVELATLINVACGILDQWALPSVLDTVWSIRIVMNALLALCFFATWHRNFERLYPAVVFLMFVPLGLGINAMIWLAAPGELAVDTYYGGLLLITMGVYTLSYARLTLSILISATMIGTYVAVSVVGHDFLNPDKVVVLAINLFFFVSATVLGIVAQRVRDRYSRENYLLRHSLERDVELQEAAKLRASFLAEHDALTGLPNRLSFERRATEILDAAVEKGARATVLFIDLDKFKPINDRHGHAAGDRVLKVIGQRLTEELRDTDTVARYGGDEFVACLNSCENIAPVIRKLVEAIERPVNLRGADVAVSASIGVAMCPDDGRTLEELVERADGDMYRRKHSTSNLVVAEN